jgi:hypothetical protein
MRNVPFAEGDWPPNYTYKVLKSQRRTWKTNLVHILHHRFFMGVAGSIFDPYDFLIEHEGKTFWFSCGANGHGIYHTLDEAIRKEIYYRLYEKHSDDMEVQKFMQSQTIVPKESSGEKKP